VRHVKNKTVSQPNVRLHRTIQATPSQVYRAWLDPKIVRQWMAPADELQVTRVEIDERVGGRYRIWQGTDEGDRGGFECKIVELVPSRRIVFDWGFVGPDRDGPVYDSRLTLTFEPAPDEGTQITLLHERLDALAAAMPEGADMVEVGWDIVLEKLADTLTTRRSA